jgi:hypothetical protein
VPETVRSRQSASTFAASPPRSSIIWKRSEGGRAGGGGLKWLVAIGDVQRAACDAISLPINCFMACFLS